MLAVPTAMKNVTLLCALALLTACASGPKTVKQVNAVEVDRATRELPPEALLSVGVAVFDPNIPADAEEREKENVFPSVREAEARYFPYVLRDAMESTSQWGPVRVIPSDESAVDVIVSGKILLSDGERLWLDVTATDSRGMVWFTRTYKDVASKFSYREDLGSSNGDPFQDIYHQIANDLAAFRDEKSSKELTAIHTVTDLRFAADLSTEAFGEHLSVDKNGRYKISRLPSPNDPMMARVKRIRESEELFIDTVDDQYADFYVKMDPSYDSWRRFSYEEVQQLREVKRSTRNRALLAAASILGGIAIDRKATNRSTSIVGQATTIGGLILAKTAFDRSKDGSIHEEALKELASSFDSEVAPIVMEVEGEVVKLSGSLETQFQEWRRILREIYATETGLPLQPSPAPATTADPASG